MTGRQQRGLAGEAPRWRGEVRFAAIFLGLVGGYYVLTVVPWVDHYLMLPVMVNSAQITSWLLNLTGAKTLAEGFVIQGPEFAVAVRRGCDPLEPIMLLGAAILAFPAPAWRKVWGFVPGAFLLFWLNIVRIASLYWAGQAKAAWFNSFHEEIWPAFFICVALLLWLFWLRWVQGKPVKKA